MKDQIDALSQLLSAKAELDARIEQMQREEKEAKIAEVREMMRLYDIKLSDLSGKAARPDKGKTRAGAGVPKYRDPVSGSTWTGFGRPPAWINGNKEAYRIAA